MLCEKCKKNEATGYYEGTQKGVKTVMHLCTRCLLDKQKELFGGFNMFSGFVEDSLKGPQKLRCKSCGTELNKINKTLFVGCPDCYSHLTAELNPVIKNIQGATAHVGSVPSGAVTKPEIDLLTEQLNAAIREERFEDADILSRRLKNLRGEK